MYFLLTFSSNLWACTWLPPPNKLVAVVEEVLVENNGGGGWLAKRRGEGKGDDSTTCVKLTGRAINLHTFLYDRKTTSMMNEMAIQTQG